MALFLFTRAEIEAAVDYFMESRPRQRSLDSEDGINQLDKVTFSYFLVATVGI